MAFGVRESAFSTFPVITGEREAFIAVPARVARSSAPHGQGRLKTHSVPMLAMAGAVAAACPLEQDRKVSSCALPDALALSNQERIESGLLEVAVRCERIGEIPLPHHDEGNAVGEGPIFVRAGDVELAAAVKKPGVWRDDLDIFRRAEAIQNTLELHP